MNTSQVKTPQTLQTLRNVRTGQTGQALFLFSYEKSGDFVAVRVGKANVFTWPVSECEEFTY